MLVMTLIILRFSNKYKTFVSKSSKKCFCDGSIIGWIWGSENSRKWAFCKTNTFSGPWQTLKTSFKVKPLQRWAIHKANTPFLVRNEIVSKNSLDLPDLISDNLCSFKFYYVQINASAWKHVQLFFQLYSQKKPERYCFIQAYVNNFGSHSIDLLSIRCALSMGTISNRALWGGLV